MSRVSDWFRKVTGASGERTSDDLRVLEEREAYSEARVQALERRIELAEIRLGSERAPRGYEGY